MKSQRGQEKPVPVLHPFLCESAMSGSKRTVAFSFLFGLADASFLSPESYSNANSCTFPAFLNSAEAFLRGDEVGGKMGGANPGLDALGIVTNAECVGFILIAETSFGLLLLLTSGFSFVKFDGIPCPGFFGSSLLGLFACGLGTELCVPALMVPATSVRFNEIGDILTKDELPVGS
jgi:hypothetical protein